MDPKKCMMVLLLVSALPAIAKMMPFVDANFDSLVRHTIPEQQQKSFIAYYKKFGDDMANMKEDVRLKLGKQLYHTALARLEEEHPRWAHQLGSFLADLQYLDAKFDTERSDVRKFLYFHGVYGQFQSSIIQSQRPIKVVENKRFVDTMRLQVSKVTNKIGNWFSSIRAKFA